MLLTYGDQNSAGVLVYSVAESVISGHFIALLVLFKRNSFPESVISAGTFKNRLNKFWCNQDVLFNYKANLTGIGNRSEKNEEDFILHSLICRVLLLLLLRNASDLRNCTSYFGACMWVWYCRPPIGAHLIHPTPQPQLPHPFPSNWGRKRIYVLHGLWQQF